MSHYSRLLAITLLAACGTNSPGDAPNPASGFTASVRPTGALFTIQIGSPFVQQHVPPTRSDSPILGALFVAWDSVAHVPELACCGLLVKLSLTPARPGKVSKGRGTYSVLTFQKVQAGHIDAVQVGPEPALTARLHGQTVQLRLGPSRELTDLLRLRPDSVQLGTYDGPQGRWASVWTRVLYSP